MKKQTLETFIKKYSLNGIIDSVKWTITKDKKTLNTKSITEEKNVLLDVTQKNFEALNEDSEIGVYDTVKLIKMLSVMSDDVSLNLNKKDDKITSLSINDDNTEAQFITADLSVIPTAPNLKKLPDFNVEIEIDSDFVSRFCKSKSALPEVDTFTLMMNKKKKLEMVMGYSKLNSNRITLAVNCLGDKNVVDKNLSFNAKYFKEILTVNNDCKSAVLKVSNSGLATITFTNDEFESTYYMVEIKSLD
jgi:hypothetical protein